MVRKDSYVIFYFVIQFVFIFNLLSGKHKKKNKIPKVSTDVELPNTVKYVLLYFATSSENLKMTHILFAMKYYGGPLWNCVTQHKIIKMFAFPSNIFG